MRIYEASIAYNLVQLGDVQTMTTPDKIAEYYGIVQIDDALATLLKDMKWTPLFSKGRVFYQDFEVTKSDGTKVPTPICLLSFDAIIDDAACRNHTFLEILKKDLKERVAEKNTTSATPTSV